MSAGRLPLPKALRDARVQFALVTALMFVVAMLAIASQYGNSGVEVVNGERRVQSEGERCAITLPDGWSWRPATWTAVSPLGTKLGFGEERYGRPEFPDWEEAVEATLARHGGQSGVTVTSDADFVQIDFGPNGGLSYTRHFDAAGCLLTFSYVDGARAQEFATWQAIIASLERTYPGRSAEE
jgi:hypothetical protein